MFAVEDTMLAGESPVLELLGHQVVRSTAGGVTLLSEVALEQRGSLLSDAKPRAAGARTQDEHRHRSVLSWMGVSRVPSPYSLDEGCYDVVIYREQGDGEFTDLGSSNPYASPWNGSVSSSFLTSHVGSSVLSGWHVVKVSWSKAGGPYISGETPAGKTVYKGKPKGQATGVWESEGSI
jgi:hypothetical protein